MGIVVGVTLAILFAGALTGLAAYFVKRRMDRWVDAMIVSFGLMRLVQGGGDPSLREDEPEETQPRTSVVAIGARPPGELEVAEVEAVEL